MYAYVSLFTVYHTGEEKNNDRIVIWKRGFK